MQKWIAILVFCTSLISTTSAQDVNTLIDSSFLHHLPTRDLNPWLYGYFSGAVAQSYRGVPYLHVHGSRADEVVYQFEGVNIRSDYTGLSAIRFIPEVLGSVSLNKTPSASQSTASALVTHRFRNPTDKLRFSIRETSDAFTSSYEKRMGTYSYGYNNLLFTAEGRALNEKLQFIAGLEWEHYDDHFRKFWDGFVIREGDEPFQGRWSNAPSFNQVFGTHEINVQSGNIPAAKSNQVLFNGMLRYQTPLGNAKLIYLHDYRKYQNNTLPIRWLFNQAHVPEVIDHTHILSTQFESQLPAGIHSKIQFDISSMRSKTMDPVQKDDFWNYKYLHAALEPIEIPPQNYYWMSPSTDVHGFYFDWNNAILADYTKRTEDALSFSISFEKTIGSHQLCTGAVYKTSQHRYYQMKHNILSQLGQSGTDVFADTSLLASYYTKGYGYDVYGNSIDSDTRWNDGPRKSKKMEIFIEDIFQVDQTEFTLGVNYCRMSTGAYQLKDLQEPFLFADPLNMSSNYGYNFIASGNKFITSDNYEYFLPHFSWVFHQNKKVNHQLYFGKSVMLPLLSDVYMGRYEKSTIFTNYSWKEMLGSNAEPVTARTFSLQTAYQLTENTHLFTKIYSRFSDTWLQVKRISSETDKYNSYYLFANEGEGKSNGIEFNFQTKHNGVLLNANYTFSNSEGTASHPSSNLADARMDTLWLFEGKVHHVDFNQMHRFNASLLLQAPKHTKNFLRNTSLFLLCHLNSGHTFYKYAWNEISYRTPMYGYLLSETNSLYRTDPQEIATPWIFNLGIKIEKQARFGNIISRWHIAIQNLLNRKNVNHVLWRTGTTEDGWFLGVHPDAEEWWIQNYGNRVTEFYQKINADHHQNYALAQSDELFGHPREIRFGVALEFSR